MQFQGGQMSHATRLGFGHALSTFFSRSACVIIKLARCRYFHSAETAFIGLDGMRERQHTSQKKAVQVCKASGAAELDRCPARTLILPPGQMRKMMPEAASRVSRPLHRQKLNSWQQQIAAWPQPPVGENSHSPDQALVPHASSARVSSGRRGFRLVSYG